MTNQSGILPRIANAMSIAVAKVGQLLRFLLGDLRWRAPPWLAWCNTQLAVIGWRTAAYAQQRPRAAAGWSAAVLALGLAGYAGWLYYQLLPKPETTNFAVTAPALTCYACEAPDNKPKPLTITFDRSVAPLALVGKVLDGKTLPLSMSPTMPGQWQWTDDRTLVFTPRNDWPVGQEYKVQLREELIANRIELARDELTFETVAFSAAIATTEFYQDPQVAKNKKVVTTVKFSHPVVPAEFEKQIRLQLFNRITDKREEELGTTPFSVVYDKPKLTAFIHSAELATPDKSGRLQVRIEPGVRAARGGKATDKALEASVEVPGLYSLKVNGVNVIVARDERDEPAQVLLFDFSFSVDEQESPKNVQAWLLPPRHPNPKRQAEFERRAREGESFPWSPGDVTPDVLQAAAALPIKQIPGEREHYEQHSFRYQAEPGSFIFVKVRRGLQSFGGYKLGDTVERLLTVPEYPKELRITPQGSLLAMSGSKMINIFTRDVPAIRVNVSRILPRQLQHLVTQTGGDFTKPEFRDWAFDAANVMDRKNTVIRLPKLAPGTAHYEALPFGDYLKDDPDRQGIFLLKVQAWDPATDSAVDGSDPNQYSSQGSLTDARMIVITDFGMLSKRWVDGKQDVFVQSIHTGEPASGVTVDVIGKNGLPVLSETTDAEGHVRFPDMREFKYERQPVLFLARRGNDNSFLPLNGRAHALELSRFDIGGVANSAEIGTLSAYLFSDRGLYRPGDEIRIGAIVRSQDWRTSITNVPLRLEITDPRGIVIRKEVFNPGEAGFGEVRELTQETSPTGTYTVSLSVVRNQNRADLIGSVEVQVRDFMPDRLRMTTRFSNESPLGWVDPKDLGLEINVQNLFGTPAENRKVEGRLTLSPSIPSFPAYPDYQFYDPQFAREGFSEALPSGKTDAKGNAAIALNLQRFAKATYRVAVAVQAFEADGGRGVSGEAAQLVSSMPYLVGFKRDGDLGYVSRNAERRVDLVAIDNQTRKIEVKDLKLTRLETRFLSVLIKQPNGTFKYESRRKDVQLTEAPFAIAATGTQLALASETPGNFAYVLRDKDGQQLARIEYRVAGDANLTRALEKNAELQIALSKRDYAPGEDIEMQIQAPYTGAGLITIERERVYAWRWFKTDQTSSLQRIKLPAGIEGNAYVNVSFVRDPSSEEIYTSPLSYGVQPFSVSLDARRNAVTLQTPTLVKPGQRLAIKYQTEKPARIVVFAIDEGILQVARYQTPDPLGYFFQKRSLDVTTQQILDTILPGFKPNTESSAAGGDGEALLGKFLNPFRRKGEKPVAFWSGIIQADREARELQFEVPDYFNGSLRVMAVAVADELVGVSQANTLVRGDFVLSPNAPTTVTPGDEFEVSVGVSNNLEGSGAKATIDVTLEPGPALTVIGEAKQALAIPEGRESSARFRVRTRDVLGAAVLKFTASSGQARARRQIDLSVRPATPYMTSIVAGSVREGAREVPVERRLYPDYRKLDAAISVLPLGLAHGLTTYLGNYPYACTEQLISKAVPGLILAQRPEFGYIKAQPGSDLNALIGELRSRQNDIGAYRLWPGSSGVEEYVSIYAQHFLLEAGEQGIKVPRDLLDRGNEYLATLATRDGNNLTQERNAAYAIYLLTRQGRLMTTQVVELRRRLAERYAKEWETDLVAGWLAATYQLTKQAPEAERMLRKIQFGAMGRAESYYDAMTTDALLLYLYARHFPERLPKLPPEVLTRLVERINAGTYHSLSAATTVLALDAYATRTSSNTAQLGIAEILRDSKQARSLTLPSGLFPKAAFSEQAAALRFSNSSPVNGFYAVTQGGFDRKPPAAAISRGFEILREYTDDQGTVVTQVKMGQELNVRLKFRGTTNKIYSDVALVDLLPGGFDLVVPPASSTQIFREASASEATSEYEGDGGEAVDGGGWSCAFCAPGSGAWLTYADMREDRIVFYGTITPQVQEVVYRIKATNVGTYTVPPAYGEGMYDRSAVARSVAGKLVIGQ